MAPLFVRTCTTGPQICFALFRDWPPYLVSNIGGTGSLLWLFPGFGEQCLLVFKNKELKEEEEAKKR